MISKLHYITQEIESAGHAQLAEEVCKAGARWIQLRMKNKTSEELIHISKEVFGVCQKYEAKLIINDHVQLAKEIGADGVHLGKEDIPVEEARRILGNDFIIGATANTFEDIKRHTSTGADYIGLGPYRFTATKEKLSPVLGIEGYETILRQCKKENIEVPIIAIGGILPEDVSALAESGVYGVAIAGAISFSENKSLTIRHFLSALNTNRFTKDKINHE